MFFFEVNYKFGNNLFQIEAKEEEWNTDGIRLKQFKWDRRKIDTQKSFLIPSSTIRLFLLYKHWIQAFQEEQATLLFWIISKFRLTRQLPRPCIC